MLMVVSFWSRDEAVRFFMNQKRVMTLYPAEMSTNVACLLFAIFLRPNQKGSSKLTRALASGKMRFIAGSDCVFEIYPFCAVQFPEQFADPECPLHVPRPLPGER